MNCSLHEAPKLLFDRFRFQIIWPWANTDCGQYEMPNQIHRSAHSCIKLLNLVTLLLFFALCAACSNFAVAQDTTQSVDFNRDVRPILADNCFECHGPDAEAREADLRFDNLAEAKGWVIEPGRPDKSLMIDRLVTGDADLVMPPPHSKRRPTKEQIKILRKWIQQGAKYESHWAFVAPIRSNAPRMETDWARNAVDNFVAAHHKANGLQPRLDASPEVLARRLSLALTGLTVLPKTANEFAKQYESDPEQAISEFVDRLLSSESYGEHQAWSWLDAARYADTNGYQADAFREMWPWRDWLIRQLKTTICPTTK